MGIAFPVNPHWVPMGTKGVGGGSVCRRGAKRQRRRRKEGVRALRTKQQRMILDIVYGCSKTVGKEEVLKAGGPGAGRADGAARGGFDVISTMFGNLARVEKRDFGGFRRAGLHARQTNLTQRRQETDSFCGFAPLRALSFIQPSSSGLAESAGKEPLEKGFLLRLQFSHH